MMTKKENETCFLALIIRIAIFLTNALNRNAQKRKDSNQITFVNCAYLGM